jgi:predicted secreted hydrolase
LPLASSVAAQGDASQRTGVQLAQDAVQIPRDEAPHQDPEEWWYFTGHLVGTDPAGRQHCYGFEYTTFQLLDVAPVPVYFGNVAVTDLTRGTFQYGFEMDSFPVPNTPNRFSVHTGDWTMSGASGRDTLHAGIPGYTFDLQLQTNEQPALHGDNGRIPFGPIGSSAYYSWTSLLTGGTIVDHGVPVRVSGLSWMDHQWGAFDFSTGAGWDWFSVQLTNGRQYMLYFIRDRSGAIVETLGTQVDQGGRRVTHLDPSSFGLTTTGSWTSPATGITYGSGWRLTVPGGSMTVTPRQLDQEVNLVATPQGTAYWEGDAAVRGVINGSPVVGVGYAEMNPAG